MRSDFELNGKYRLMDNAELISILNVKEEELVYGEALSFEEVISKMTPAKKNLVMAGVELYKRFQSSLKERPLIRCSNDIHKYMQPIIGDCATEECWAIFLNNSLRVIKRIRISSGGINSCLIDVRILVKEAILCNATSAFLVHNHPSGNKRPSREDDMITNKTKEAFNLVDIKLIDHIIVCNDSFYSYSDEGRI